tara:strand:- start:107 stop:340 length:234 start_codon:yes stop_codon:yes gene_type:complete
VNKPLDIYISKLITELYDLKNHILDVEHKIKDKIKFANRKIKYQNDLKNHNKTSYCYVVDTMEDILNALNGYEKKEK